MLRSFRRGALPSEVPEEALREIKTAIELRLEAALEALSRQRGGQALSSAELRQFACFPACHAKSCFYNTPCSLIKRQATTAHVECLAATPPRGKTLYISMTYYVDT